MTIRAVDAVDVVLEDDHWKTHILAAHPELTPHRELVIETLRQPEGIYRSKRDRTTRIYARGYTGIMIGATLVERLNLRVVVREENSFVVTAYFAAAMWRGFDERIWPS